MKAISLKKTLSVLVCACIVAGCSSTIGNKTSPTKASFQVGRTNKNQVAEKLGLPAAIDRSDDGVEAWAYQKSPRLDGLMLVVPTVSSTEIATRNINAFFGPGGKWPKNIAAIYVFDNRGILSEVQQTKP